MALDTHPEISEGSGESKGAQGFLHPWLVLGQDHQVHGQEGDLGRPSPLSLPGLVFQR